MGLPSLVNNEECGYGRGSCSHRKERVLDVSTERGIEEPPGLGLLHELGDTEGYES